jgi:hypothetical protein
MPRMVVVCCIEAPLGAMLEGLNYCMCAMFEECIPLVLCTVRLRKPCKLLEENWALQKSAPSDTNRACMVAPAGPDILCF